MATREFRVALSTCSWVSVSNALPVTLKEIKEVTFHVNEGEQILDIL